MWTLAGEILPHPSSAEKERSQEKFDISRPGSHLLIISIGEYTSNYLDMDMCIENTSGLP